MEMNKSIKAAFKGLRTTQSKMGKTVDSLNRAEQTLAGITSDMDSIWEGKAKEKYKEECTELKQRILKLAEQIGQRQQQLAQAIAVYEDTEQKNEAETDNLSAADIF